MPPPTSVQTNSSIATSNLSSASNQLEESASQLTDDRQFTNEGNANFNAYVKNFEAYRATNMHLDANKDYAKSASLDVAEYHLSFLSKLPNLTPPDQKSMEIVMTLLGEFRPNSEVLKAANAVKAAKLQMPTT